MHPVIGRVLIACGLTLGFSCVSAWAAGPDNSEDICTTAAVIFCENFETRAVVPAYQTLNLPIYKNNGWQPYAYDCMRVTDNPTGIFDGTRAYEDVYYEGPTTGCGYLYTIFPGGPYTELYFRWYTKHSSNFVWSQVANKLMNWLNSAQILRGHLGGYRLTAGTTVMDIGVDTLGWAQPGTDGCNTAALQPYANLPGQHCELQPNENGLTPYVAGVWYCEEVHLRMNTCPTCANGLVEKWIGVGTDPTQVRHWNYPNVVVDGGTASYNQQISGISSASYWNCNAGDLPTNPDGSCSPGTNSFHPLMYRWKDNFVVSTQRIGCLGNPVAPQSGTTPPRAPTNLRVI